VKKALIAAGGTGGHLLPAQQLAELLREKQGMEVVFAGYKLDKSPYFRREQFVYREVPAERLGSWKFLWKLCVGTVRAIKLLRTEKPDVVVGFGSYHTVPVLLAATLLRKKIVLFEANTMLGKVNRLFRPFATKIAGQFLPIRDGKDVRVKCFPWVTKVWNKLEARRELGLETDKFTVLVFGGSQGAKFLNEMIPLVAERLPHVQWLHIAGNETAADEIRSRFMGSGKVFAFSNNMPLLYAAADMAVCRSGAGTVAELMRFGVPAILIPYPHAADNHQWHNAQILVERGVGICVLQDEATVDVLVNHLQTWKPLAMRVVDEHNVDIDVLVGEL